MKFSAVAPSQQKMQGEVPGEFDLPRDENVFYNSARAKRSLIGRWHYCISCPGWNKMTNKRVVYSRWEMAECCFGLKCPCGRQLDQYDADIIVDASAHQTLCQACRGEGDLVLHRLAGGDISDGSPIHVLTDVASVFDVFNKATFELAQISLKGLATMGLGRRMGAVTWEYPAGCDGDPVKKVDMNQERVYYDSKRAKRTRLAACCNADCCFPNVYKITSERVMYAEWDLWYLCDNPLTALAIPFYCCRGIWEDCCCAAQVAARREEALKKGVDVAWAEKVAQHEARNCVTRNCVCPTGRSAYFFDLDILVDIGAHQRCVQVCLNEGDLLLHRLAGADKDNSDTTFVIKNVPEVFNLFDDFSWQLSQMNLSHYRQSAMGQDMR
jgi:hypothetical protein